MSTLYNCELICTGLSADLSAKAQAKREDRIGWEQLIFTSARIQSPQNWFLKRFPRLYRQGTPAGLDNSEEIMKEVIEKEEVVVIQS